MVVRHYMGIDFGGHMHDDTNNKMCSSILAKMEIVNFEDMYEG